MFPSTVGGANDIFTKQPSPLEVYNDLDSNVFNLFRVLRDRKEELIRAILYTPYSREEANVANDTFAALGSGPGHIDELERARRFYVQCNQGRSSGSSVWRTTWRYMVRDLRSATLPQDWAEVDKLATAAARLKMVQLENRPALDLIPQYDTPETLFYADPPYLHDTRSGNWLKAYRYEMSPEDHRALADHLQKIQGMAIVSGYPCDLYAELYETRGWRREEITARTNANTPRVEAIWLNRAVQDRLGGGQMALPILVFDKAMP